MASLESFSMASLPAASTGCGRTEAAAAAFFFLSASLTAATLMSTCEKLADLYEPLPSGRTTPTSSMYLRTQDRGQALS